MVKSDQPQKLITGLDVQYKSHGKSKITSSQKETDKLLAQRKNKTRKPQTITTNSQKKNQKQQNQKTQTTQNSPRIKEDVRKENKELLKCRLLLKDQTGRAGGRALSAVVHLL